MGRAKKGFVVTAALAALATVLAACGSSGGGGTTATTAAAAPGGSSSSAAAPATTPSGSSSSSSGVVAEMQALIDKYKVQPTFTPPGPSLDASKLKGKTIAVVVVDTSIGTMNDIAKAVTEAAGKVGMKTTIFDAKSSPNLMQQGFQQAINNGADAIVNDGNVVKIVANQIKAAKDKGIPTVEDANSPPVSGVAGQGSDPNTFGNVAPDSFLDGELSAATAIVNTNGHAHVVIMNTSEVTASPTIVKGMKAALAKCSGCSIVETTDTPLAQWSTGITGLTATVIRSHPDVNYLLPIYSDMGIFAAAGIQQAGAVGKVHIASFNGSPAAEALVKKGDVYAVDSAEDNEWIGWAVVDQCMRGMLKMKPADPVTPTRWVDTKMLQDGNVDTSSTSTLSAALFGDAYKQGFLKLWGVS